MLGIADYLSRQHSENASNIHKIKAEEMWNNWFTVNEITKNKFVSDTAQAQNAREQPIAPYAVNDSQWQGSDNSPSESELTKASDAANVNKQTLNEIATIIKTSQSSEAEEASETMTEEFRHAANQPPLKVPMCYSVNQIEVLQTLGNFTFDSQYETDENMQSIVALLKEPDSTKINRLPTPWREKSRYLSLDPNDFLYG